MYLAATRDREKGRSWIIHLDNCKVFLRNFQAEIRKPSKKYMEIVKETMIFV